MTYTLTHYFTIGKQMRETITIAANATTAKLHMPTREVKLIAQAALSYRVNGSEQSVAFKRGSWDGRSSFFDFRDGKFPAGFVHYVSAHFRRKGYDIRLVRNKLPEPLGAVNPVVDAFPEDPNYDYQMEVVITLVKHGQIIAQVATGGGKSRIARLAFARINRPTLFLTTRSLLMYQMKDTFEKDLGVAVSVFGDGQFGSTKVVDGVEVQTIKKMSVGMVQTLAARIEEKTVDSEIEKMIDARNKRDQKKITALRLKLESSEHHVIEAAVKKLTESLEKEHVSPKEMLANVKGKVEKHMLERQRTINLLAKFEFVILEEAHEAAGDSYFQIMRHCKNANYRLALTATPFMKDDEESNMRLMAVSGPVGIKITEKLLIDRGILAKPIFKTVVLKIKPPKMYKSTPWQSAYRLGITDNEERNDKIVQECKRAALHKMSVMLLVQHTAHGEHLRALIAQAGVRVSFIQGEDDHEERKCALAQLAAGEIDVIIGTTILDVGVDVPAVGMIILAGGGKAEVALRQRIGRGLRKKKFGPNIALVVDFADDFNSHLKGHAMQRLAIIKDTPGFVENILPSGADFDFISLGLAVKAAA
jgi:superfamily II DNA or RNA helicase